MSNITPFQDEHLWSMAAGAVIGSFGGLINAVRSKSLSDWSKTAAIILTAGFTGMVAQLLAGWLSSDTRFQFAIGGIAGYGGGVLLDDLVQRVRCFINKTGDAIDSVSKVQNVTTDRK